MDGIQPQAVDAEPGQVVQSASEPGEITDTVAVGVLERLDVQAVNDCLLIPALGHVPSLSRAPPPRPGPLLGWAERIRETLEVVVVSVPVALWRGPVERVRVVGVREHVP